MKEDKILAEQLSSEMGQLEDGNEHTLKMAQAVLFKLKDGTISYAEAAKRFKVSVTMFSRYLIAYRNYQLDGFKELEETSNTAQKIDCNSDKERAKTLESEILVLGNHMNKEALRIANSVKTFLVRDSTQKDMAESLDISITKFTNLVKIYRKERFSGLLKEIKEIIKDKEKIKKQGNNYEAMSIPINRRNQVHKEANINQADEETLPKTANKRARSNNSNLPLKRRK